MNTWEHCISRGGGLIKTLALLGLLSAPLSAQSFNAGAGVVHSSNLGFDDLYGFGLVEASLNYPRFYLRAGVEVLDAEKQGQDGYGANMDLTATVPIASGWGVHAFYRPSMILQSEYNKSAHTYGAGVTFIFRDKDRWDVFYAMSNDEYKMRRVGFEWRAGRGQWLRVKGESVEYTHPVLGIDGRGSRISVAIAPRISW